MKKFTYFCTGYFTVLVLFFTTISSFGQNFTITPFSTIAENVDGDNIKLKSNSSNIGIQSFKYNGNSTVKTPVVVNDALLRLGAGGYFTPTSAFYERGAIYFKATQNWSTTAMGTKITFETTANDNTSPAERMVIAENGNIGIANTMPAAKLHINHLASAISPHLQLNSTGTSASLIKTTSTTGNSWENYFLNGATAATNLVYWVNSVNSATPLILTGEGDAIVERNVVVNGYTNLGSGSPKIKMKELTITTGTLAGGVAYVAHGITLNKILSVSVLVNSSTGHDYPPSYGSTTAPGFEYFYFITSTHVVLENSSTSYANIAGRPARILVTYKE